RHGDDRWFDIVKFVVQAPIAAEDMGITQANVDDMLKSDDPRIARFLGVEPGNGKELGLDEKWAYNIVKQLGNYGEMFERNVGKNGTFYLILIITRLYMMGGAMYRYMYNSRMPSVEHHDKGTRLGYDARRRTRLLQV